MKQFAHDPFMGSKLDPRNIAITSTAHSATCTKWDLGAGPAIKRFANLLRTGKIYSLRKSDGAFNPSSKPAIVAVVHDPLIVQALQLLCKERRDDELLYSRPARFLGEDLK